MNLENKKVFIIKKIELSRESQFATFNNLKVFLKFSEAKKYVLNKEKEIKNTGEFIQLKYFDEHKSLFHQTEGYNIYYDIDKKYIS